MSEQIEVTKEHLEFLNGLRRSGRTNMFGAGPYIEEFFEVSKKEARHILKHWMENFKEEDR